ncbi:hypothetical protein [Bowmanella pacifica]|uniref:Uncharacterized protein n=1 Tax=Bowmanella pacifica TaxID=502051 RepID=A0A918DLB8_9ALTE|nr:hypothetical protein [Bowmanella pacifica]GGO72294.1 hypothetical protein GCM10010982_30070 [Bowmanella pacifica]
MHHDENFKDPFNVKYLLAALVTAVALPLLHVVLGWFVYYL